MIRKTILYTAIVWVVWRTLDILHDLVMSFVDPVVEETSAEEEHEKS